MLTPVAQEPSYQRCLGADSIDFTLMSFGQCAHQFQNLLGSFYALYEVISKEPCVFLETRKEINEISIYHLLDTQFMTHSLS